MFYGAILWLNETFPGLVQKCPYTTFKVTNGTFSLRRNGEYIFQSYANGKFRASFIFFDDIDDFIGEIIFYFEVNYRNNYVDFK